MCGEVSRYCIASLPVSASIPGFIFKVQFSAQPKRKKNCNLSSFNADFILYTVIKLQFFAGIFYIASNSVSCAVYEKVSYSFSLTTIVTHHCYVISFGAGKRLNVIITIMKLQNTINE